MQVWDYHSNPNMHLLNTGGYLALDRSLLLEFWIFPLSGRQEEDLKAIDELNYSNSDMMIGF